MDVSGYRLKDAREKLKAVGIEVSAIKVTAPPREQSEECDESYRVIRVKSLEENKVELLVCKPL